MSDRDSALTERIHQLKPDLQIRSIELNTEGLLNEVLIVNRELVFRFAKDERAKAALESEAKLLQFLDGRVSLLIPRVETGERFWFLAHIGGARDIE